MSERITQELRDVTTTGVRLSDYNENVLEETLSVLRTDFESRCDAIDSIHANLERENDRLKCELDRVLGELDEMHKSDEISDISDGFMHEAEHHAWAPESHYVMLPKDVDGEPIHIGDMLDGYGKTIEVVELRYGRSGWVLISREGSGYADTFAFAHHHAPTVEDLLREFAYGLGVPVADSYVAATAAKLRWQVMPSERLLQSPTGAHGRAWAASVRHGAAHGRGKAAHESLVLGSFGATNRHAHPHPPNPRLHVG